MYKKQLAEDLANLSWLRGFLLVKKSELKEGVYDSLAQVCQMLLQETQSGMSAEGSAEKIVDDASNDVRGETNEEEYNPTM